MRHIVLGDEAVAQGAIDAGISGMYAYPGTPSTEITEYIQKKKRELDLDLHTTWSANEKTAMESALGMSYAGKRVMVAMKHVGLNVAMDAFMNSAIAGVNGGLVVVVADDPSMHSSQNEQDSRFLAHFAKIPILEPSNQQEAYDCIRHAFKLSELTELPVLVRLVTRLAHSRSLVTFNVPDAQKEQAFLDDIERFKLIPARAKPQYASLVKKQVKLREYAQESPFNQLVIGNDKTFAIVCSGIAYNYYMEKFDGVSPYTVLKVSQYPIPIKQIRDLYKISDKLLILEDGYPFIEEQLQDHFADSPKIIGKLTGHIPPTGELNPDIVAKALGEEEKEVFETPEIIKNRPPRLCDGCGHYDTFNVVKALDDIVGGKQVFGDIGCYALGALPPYNVISTLIDMGASITMAKGASDAGVFPAVAIIGDSTFIHSGMTGLLDCINDKASVTVIISDNSAIAMTGGQDSSALAKLKSICIGLGVEPDHLRVMQPLSKYHDGNVEILREELNYKGVSVIISQRACVQLPSERKKEARAVAYDTE